MSRLTNDADTIGEMFGHSVSMFMTAAVLFFGCYPASGRLADDPATSRILVYGAGFSDSRLVQDDLDRNGNLDEKIAPYNRAVNILDVDNTIAKSYINGTYKP